MCILLPRKYYRHKKILPVDWQLYWVNSVAWLQA